MATVLSIIALALSFVSIVWQVRTWKAGGPVVVVTATVSFPVGNEDEAVILATVSNRGRSATEIDGCYVAFGLPDNPASSYYTPLPPHGKRRLDAHSSFDDYRLRVKTLLEATEAVDHRSFGVHAAARLATGEFIVSEKPIPLTRFLS